MPRKFLKRYSPSQKTIKENKSLSILGERLHKPSLWIFNRNSVAKAFAIGLFCAWLPIPMQTVLAAVLAIYYRAHLPLSIVLVFISNPITMPPMLFFAYKLGSTMLGLEFQMIEMDMNWHWFTSILGQIWQPLLFGCLILAIVCSAIAYFTINTIWRNDVRARWRERSLRKSAKKAEKEVNDTIKESS